MEYGRNVEEELVSVQAGVWHFDGEPTDQNLLSRISQTVVQYGADSEETYIGGAIGMLYRPFHTTKESHLEVQPYVSPKGVVMTWDGRLDNRDDLTIRMRNELTSDTTDVAVVSAMFDRWDTACFQWIIGDWALSIWDPRKRTLILARDYMGVRHLYYHLTQKSLAFAILSTSGTERGSVLGTFGPIALFLVVAVIFPIVPLVLSGFLAPHKPNPVKLEPYESGMETIGPTHVQFPIRYYLYALIFVIFDVEVIYLFPWALVYDKLPVVAAAEMAVFIVLLLVGLAYAMNFAGKQRSRSIDEILTGSSETARQARKSDSSV